MRILLTSPGTHPWSASGIGGGPTTVHKYAEKIALRGHEVWVIFPSWERNVEHPVIPYTPVFIRPRRHFLRCFDIAQMARRLVRKHKIDVVHTIGWQGAWVHRACREIAFGVGSTHLPEVPQVSWRDVALGREPRSQTVKFLLDRMNCTSAHAAIAISKYARDQIIERYHIPPEKVYLAYSGIDKERIVDKEFSEEARTERGLMKVLFVGRLAQEKGIRDLLEMTRLLKAQDLAFSVDVVGPSRPGGEGFVSALLAQFTDISDRVTFHGGVSPSQVDSFYGKASLLVHPSYMESFGLVLVEAMARGVPVVAYRSGAVPEVVEEGTTGLLTSAGDPEGLATAVARLLKRPDEASRLGNAGPAQAAKFTWERAAERLEKIYIAVQSG